MCGPVGAILGGAVSAMGSIMAGNAQAAAYKAQAKAAEFEAGARRMQGQYEASRVADKGLRLTGDQIVAYASEGIDPSSASVGDVIADSRTEVALDVGVIKTNARNAANAKMYESDILKMQAKSAKQAGMIGGVSAMIGGVSSAVNMMAGIGSSFTGGAPASGPSLAPTVNTPAPALPQPRPVGSVTPAGNVPVYGYSYYGGPR